MYLVRQELGLRQGAGMGLGSCPQEWGNRAFTQKQRAQGDGAVPAQVGWYQSGVKAAAQRGWKGPTRFNPSLAKSLPLHGGKTAFIKE